tara:strand:+ start:291 stop:488 length:198 start_codon:yes stop_codon:yes gene_type:complete
VLKKNFGKYRFILSEMKICSRKLYMLKISLKTRLPEGNLPTENFLYKLFKSSLIYYCDDEKVIVF